MKTMSGMDQKIVVSRWRARNLWLIAAACAAVLVLAFMGLAGSKTRSTVKPERLSVAQVQRGEFHEYVPVNGTVLPSATVFLDLEEGGIVEHVYLQPGAMVKQGDLILSFSNNAVQKQNIEAETRLLENLNELRNSRYTLARSGLMLRQDLLDVEYEIQELQRTHQRYERLMSSRSAALSREQYETSRDKLEYLQRKHALLEERIERETGLQQQQEAQIQSSMERVSRNLQVLSRIVDSLEVRAPVDGLLSALGAEQGQSFQRGERIGQIDQASGFKVRADVDQYYVSSVATGRISQFTFNGRVHELKIVKIYPEVRQEMFQADMEFVGAMPEGLKRGQKLQLQLSLSESRAATLVEKGQFTRATGGRWVYLLAPDGRSAVRTPVVLGRQNPQYVEVLEGLRPGDWIVTSSYENFGGVEEVALPEPPPAFRNGREE
ncbi:MAG TPA: HlyD family efflux transporter periplasmic adaptor subunit [Povalibacter sp.]|mgnify:CR=1 FL=1|uniref:efflux RND transporter periplasmic adaptor subunit n=1 Tax=Povalibacter sp. TaxID=1962978 RepID=UPI002B660A2E|nr:HlyD family efflux transporter periplasmic adaptor subunit [Povalibacter sp.]HMN46379.1 HlyD family efflux transporter periplasmic adaptor subunit [Povalibacter sp.]